MRIFQEGTNRQKVLMLKEIPSAMQFRQGEPGTLFFGEDRKLHVGCLECIYPRCLYFSEGEIECGKIKDFPADKNTCVCPVDALAWNDNKFIPSVNNDKCISCGICASRCPVGALFFTTRGKLLLNTDSSELVEEKEYNSDSSNWQVAQIERLNSIPRSGVFLNVSDTVFGSIYEKLSGLDAGCHNLLGRNLLIALGCKCSISRVGDVYTRMDAVYSSQGGDFGAVEIEFGQDTLEAVRVILDDIAVLERKYRIKKDDNNALVICLRLPNARQGYWQVVKDIKDVVSVKVGTISIGALMILLWNRRIFAPEGNRYYLDSENMNLRKIICKQMDCDNVQLTRKEFGILEPYK